MKAVGYTLATALQPYRMLSSQITSLALEAAELDTRMAV